MELQASGDVEATVRGVLADVLVLSPERMPFSMTGRTLMIRTVSNLVIAKALL